MPTHQIDTQRFSAVLFDLDGVVTDTAKVHADCWKRMFDAFLSHRAAIMDVPFQPFDMEADYLRYVDGRPRYQGVEAFLDSRGIKLPYGVPGDLPDRNTICGLGNRKNTLLKEALARGGVTVYPDALNLLDFLQRRSVRTAVVSSSKNCAAILKAANLDDRFEVRVDGESAARLGLTGKPAPDTFLKAAELLGVAPPLCVILEDAISGVEAGRAGGFGLVVGVDRKGDGAELLGHGADLVVGNLQELLSGKRDDLRPMRSPGKDRDR